MNDQPEGFLEHLENLLAKFKPKGEFYTYRCGVYDLKRFLLRHAKRAHNKAQKSRTRGGNQK